MALSSQLQMRGFLRAETIFISYPKTPARGVDIPVDFSRLRGAITVLYQKVNAGGKDDSIAESSIHPTLYALFFSREMNHNQKTTSSNDLSGDDKKLEAALHDQILTLKLEPTNFIPEISLSGEQNNIPTKSISGNKAVESSGPNLQSSCADSQINIPFDTFDQVISESQDNVKRWIDSQQPCRKNYYITITRGKTKEENVYIDSPFNDSATKYSSSVICSIIERRGFQAVVNVEGPGNDAVCTSYLSK